LGIPPAKIHKKQDVTDRALSLRGGGVLGTPVTKENLATCYTAMWAFNGILGMPAPEKAAYVLGFTLQEGTLGYAVYELFGSTCVGLAVMSYLATSTNSPAAKIVMYGALSCFYTFFRGVLKGTWSNVGYMDYFGTANLAVMAPCIYAIQS
jgi:hypothetical protein